MKPGDVITSQRANGEWKTHKILAVDTWPDGTEIVHCLFYESTLDEPIASTLDSLQVKIYHAPVRSAAFKDDFKVVASRAVTADERVGYLEYLRQVD